MRVIPAEPDSGILFVRSDIGARHAEVPAHWRMVAETHLSTTLGNADGTRVQGVEYLLAAMYACGIDNARIMLDGPEAPIMDGSALPYASRISKIGSASQPEPRRAILIKQPVSFFDKDKHAGFTPFPYPWIHLEFDFEPGDIGWQRLSLPIDQRTFLEELAPARTAGVAAQAGAAGATAFPRGASPRPRNAVMTGGDRIMHEDGPRHPDEYVRHAAVCCLGDMALAGARIVGRLSGRRPTRQIYRTLLRELMTREDCWELTTVAEATRYWKKLAE
jgi:UDP-3-O-[3-hydroxymyristoyl] N-acetylglucosamine deacetylase